MQQPPDRVLIIRLSSVGDIVLSSLLVRVLRQHFPQSEIDYLVKAEFSELMQHNPYLTRVIQFPTNGTFHDLRSLRRDIRQRNYGVIIDIHDSLRSRYLCFGAHRAVRIDKRRIARFFLVKFKWNLYGWFGGAPSVAERYLETVRQFGITNDDNGLELFVPDSAHEKVNAFLASSRFNSSKPLIAVCPAAKHQNKMWPQERFAEAAATLGTDLNAGIVLFGSGPEEEYRARDIEDQIRKRAPEVPVLNGTGQLSLLEAAALMDHCCLVFSNDSGLMHIAAARKRKILAIFGPTVQEFGFFPFGTTSSVVENATLSCRPCTHIGLPDCPKRHFKCMNDLSVSEVLHSARTLLQR